jgi:hypothetical protein
MKILNLTQYLATASQIKAGVVDLPEDERDKLRKLLTFDTLPLSKELIERSEAIAEIARKTGCDTAMIGGVPYMLTVLERSLNLIGIHPVYSFMISERVKQINPYDGFTQIANIHRHVGFVIAV